MTGHIADASGHVVASIPNIWVDATWSPDSTRIEAWTGGSAWIGSTQISIYGIDGALQESLSLPTGYVRVPRAPWLLGARRPIGVRPSRPGGAPTGYWQLPVDGSAPRRLAQDDLIARSGGDVSFSPDGRRMVANDGEYARRGQCGRHRPRAVGSAGALRADLVADGDAGRVRAVLDADAQTADIGVVDIASGTDRTVVTGLQVNGPGLLGWSPAGDRILFAGLDQKGSSLWSVNADGTDRKAAGPRSGRRCVATGPDPVSRASPVADEPSVTVPVGRVLDRRSRRLPVSTLVLLGVGAIAFALGLHFGGAPSGETAALAATHPPPTPSAGESTTPTNPAVASGSPFASPPGWSDFLRRFDAAGVIESLPGGANCSGGSPGSWIAPRTGSNLGETFVKTWLLFCSPVALDKRDAFLNVVVDAIAPVDRPIWDGLGGVMAVTRYEEGGFVGSVTLATRASVDVIEIAVTLEEQPAPLGDPTVSGPGVGPGTTPAERPATTPSPAPTPTMPVPLPTPTTPVSLTATGALAPGTYSLANPHRDCAGGCADYQRVIFTLPAGWATDDGLVYKHLDQQDEAAFSAWTVAQVYADPCHWQGGVLGSMPGALGLATRLVDQAGLKASALTDATLGDVYALRMEIPVPAQLDIASCDRGEFRRWTEVGTVDRANTHYASGQIDWVYVVDVDRAPLVIDALHMPATSREDLTELDAILASMSIVR